jgi:hypothetical protein
MFSGLRSLILLSKYLYIILFLCNSSIDKRICAEIILTISSLNLSKELLTLFPFGDELIGRHLIKEDIT